MHCQSKDTVVNHALSVQGYCGKSGISSFADRVTTNYAYSPFKYDAIYDQDLVVWSAYIPHQVSQGRGVRDQVLLLGALPTQGPRGGQGIHDQKKHYFNTPPPME